MTFDFGECNYKYDLMNANSFVPISPVEPAKMARHKK